MTYRIARNGQIYGPYSLAETERYIAAGNILLTDLAQAEGMQEWLPVEQLFPTAPAVSSQGAIQICPLPDSLDEYITHFPSGENRPFDSPVPDVS